MDTKMGLENVVVAETELSDVDGEGGRLIVRGFPIEEIVGSYTFEDAWLLLWDGAAPSEEERNTLRAELASARLAAFARLSALGDALDRGDGMDALRSALGHLEASGEPRRDAVTLTGAAAVFATAWARWRSGAAPVPPDPSLRHAADFLHMLGLSATPEHADALDAYLCCVIDHGLNASTLAARVVASTGSDMVSAVVAGVAALKGPLHGGAPGPVLDMLDAIGAPERARGWLAAELDAGRRIMGMGHRVYRVRDPRAAALEGALARLTRSGGGGGRLALARAVEREAEPLLAERHPDRRLLANVEFYTAVLLEAVGLPRTLFSPTFAASRVAGWCAHFLEQQRTGRLMRPLSRYVGPGAGDPRNAPAAATSGAASSTSGTRTRTRERAAR